MQVQWTGTKDELYRSLKLIPAVLAGKHNDTLGIADLFWTFVGNAVLTLVRQGYEVKLAGGRGLDGIRWKPLAESTLAKRRREGRYDEEILIETKRLIDSLKAGVGWPASAVPDQVFKIEPGKVTVGTEVPYADYHQEGTAIMPARPIMPPDGQIPKGWESSIEDAMEAALQAVIERVCAAGGIA